MTKKKKQKLTQEQKEQIAQKKEIRGIFNRIGFNRIKGVEGKHFIYESKQSELDDIFIIENVFLIVEYTIGEKYKEHLAKKKLLYDKILENPGAFIDFLLKDARFEALREYYNQNVKPSYPNYAQIQLRIVYCSKVGVSDEYRDTINNIRYLDLYVCHYFKCLTAALKMSALNEFLDFLDIKQSDYGENVSSSQGSSLYFKAQVLPEVKSRFKQGYKIVTFYMDPQSILTRAYVLRHEGWKDKQSALYYQRMADTKRIAEIRKYLVNEKRVFVNNIIVTMSANDVTFYDGTGKLIEVTDEGKFKNDDGEVKTKVIEMSIADKPNCIGIIDGQHRVFSYHIGDDPYEKVISKLRKEQNLLVTGIVFPKNEIEEERRKFEATLFQEINVKQKKIDSQLQQELAVMVEPFSIIAIGKDIISRLSENGPLGGKLERYSYETGMVKTPSIVSYGLKPLIKIGDETDSLYSVWKSENKEKLKSAREESNHEIKKEYVAFCVESIRNLFIGVKANIVSDEWKLYDPSDRKGLLSITFINGFLNLLRFIIEKDGKLYTSQDYISRLKGVKSFSFRGYKTSHYRKMGEDLYNKVFNSVIK
jgi:DGQHR domain-containing protein